MKKLFFASYPQKALLIFAILLSTIVCLLSLWLWSLGKAPVVIIIVFGLFSTFLVYRLYGLNVNPVVLVDEPTIKILAWSTSYVTFDLKMKMDVYLDDNQIIVKQGGVGAGISRYVVGNTAFDELAEIFNGVKGIGH